MLPAALLLAVDRVLLATPFSRANDGIIAPPWRGSPEAAAPAVVKTRLLHALSVRGARRQYGTFRNLRLVGARGLAGSAATRFARGSRRRESSGGRATYLIEHTGPTTGLEGRQEWLPTPTVARLMGLLDFVAMLPELSERRARLQGQRRRSDREIVERFGANWTNAVPSERLDLHMALHDAMLDVLRVKP